MAVLADQSKKAAHQAGHKYISTLLDQAKIYYQKSDWNKAAELLEQVVKISSPYLVEAHFLLANVYHVQGRIGKALPAFKKVLELDSEHTDAMVSLSVILNDIGQYEEAKKFFELADSKIKKNSNGIVDPHVNKKFSELHYELAQMYETYRRYDEAIIEYKKAINLDGESLNLKFKLAKIYYKRSDYQTAKEELQQLKQINSAFHPASLLLGEIYCAEGKLLDAHREWNRVLAQDPNNHEAKMLLNFAKDVKEININQ
jgi:tetratricopeptide (TPR) repeat protein